MSFGNPWALLILPPGIVGLFLISRNRLMHLAGWRRRITLGLRLLLLAALTLALADARLLRNSQNLSVVFLVDHSDSINPASRQTAQTFIQNALAQKPADDTAGIVVFGANAVVEETPRQNLAITELVSQPDTGYTNIADAIRLGLALFPPDSPRRLVLLSDGRNNLGDPLSAAQLAAAGGAQLNVVELPTLSGPEVRLQTLNTPDTLHEGERFDLEMTLESNLATQSEVQIFADGRLIAREPVKLNPGSNRFIFPMTAGEQGFSTFQARLTPAEDTLLPNNRLDTFSLVEGPVQVLVVADKPAEARNLVAALTAGGLRPQLVSPAQMPAAALDLSEYAAVILVNLPATSLSPARIALLQVYVRDLGRGLVVTGGPDSFGPGGYFQTPLEETLPVEMTLKDPERLPGMSMFMVIDKSGSMADAGTVNRAGLRKVELAKEAVYRAVDFLTPWDRVGVVAFDDSAKWVVQPENVANVSGIKDRVGTIRADGGTDILAGLKIAAGAMVEEKSRVRHIVLLTDGGADSSGILELVDNLALVGVSVSVVAIGDDYAPFLKDVAKRGNGRFHLARDATTIPQIFAQEATLALKTYLIEEDFSPQVAASSPILRGITALPNLQGYVATTPKDTAQKVLVSDKGDPVLAQWQYGLGRSVAWTSDAGGRWAKAWPGWADYARFWGQTVRWTIVAGAGGRLETQVTPDTTRGVFRLTVEALDSRGNYLNDLVLQGKIVQPDLSTTEITPAQTAPGLYQAEFRPAQTGAYLLTLLGVDPAGRQVGSATRGFVVSYSPEYATDNPNPTLMADLAELGGGHSLSTDDAGTVFAHTLPPVNSARPLWPLLLSVFLFILPLDVGVRRIIFGREDWLKLARKVRRYLPAPAAHPQPLPAGQSSAGKLLSIKQAEQAAPEKSVEADTPPQPVVIIERPAPETKSPADTESAGEDRMSRLLQAKRKAQK